MDLDGFEDTAEIEISQPVKDEAAAKPVETQVETVEAGTAADAASSTATDGSKTEGDVLSVVRDVVDKRKADTEAASSAKAEEDGGDPEAQSTKAKDGDDYSDVPFNKHPRFQEVLGKLKAAETDAVRYRNVQGFLDRENLSGEDAAQGLVLLAKSRNEGLTGDEMADGLRLMALAKTDPSAAWRGGLQEWVQKVIIAAGEWLPDDLGQRVQNGELSREAAMELSRSRAQVQTYEARKTFEQQQAESRRTKEASDALVGAANTWISERTTRDPNFNAKLPAIQEEVVKLRQMGWVPTTPDGVKEQLRRAYTAVNNALRPSTPTAPPAPPAAARPALKPVTGGQVAGNVSPPPQSTAEIVAARLAKRRVG